MFIALLQIVASLASQASPSTDLRYDTGGRPIISATINDQGPFDLVIDTGAQGSLLTPDLVREVALPPAADQVTIEGATGNERADVYRVNHFVTGLFDVNNVSLLSLPNPATTSARGIIGMEWFARLKLVFDRSGGRVRVERSGPAGAGWASLPGRVEDGQLTVPLIVNGVTIDALVDTGARETVANLQVLKAIGWATDDPRLIAAGEIRGAAMSTAPVRIARMDTVRIGPASLGRVPMLFADLNGDETRPAIILGSDLLRLLEAYALDFPRGELQISVPSKASSATAK